MADGGTTYEISADVPARVREDLYRLWTANLELETSAQDKFRWLYEDAPDPSETVFMLRAKAEDGTTRAVGTNGIAVRRYHVAGRDARAGVIGDLAVDREHRGLLPALRLVRAVREFVVPRFDVAYGFPNAKADGVMVRAGFRVLGKAQRWARVLRHASYAGRLGEREGVSPVLVRLAKIPMVARLGGAAVDVVKLSSGGGGTARAALRYRLRYGARFDERFDALWEAARRDYDIIGARTSRFLAWRYPKCEVATLVRRDDGVMCAYAIIERELSTRAAHVRDVFGHKDALEPLLDMLLPSLWSRGAISVSVRFLGAPAFERLIAARGFEPRGPARTVIVQVGDAAGAERERLEDASRWHLFDVDEDV